MNLNIIYSSRSGNTKRLAEGIHERYCTSTLLAVQDAQDVVSDLHLICCWIDKAKPDEATLNQVQLFEGKKIIVMATLGAYTNSDHGKDCIQNIKDIYRGADLLGVKLVQGSVSQDMVDMFKRLPADHPHALTEAKLERYEKIKGCPRQEEIIDAYDWMIKTLEDKHA